MDPDVTMGAALAVLWPWIIGGLTAIVAGATVYKIITGPFDLLRKLGRIILDPDEGEPLQTRVRTLEDGMRGLSGLPDQVAALRSEAAESSAMHAKVLAAIGQMREDLRGDEEPTGRHSPVLGGDRAGE